MTFIPGRKDFCRGAIASFFYFSVLALLACSGDNQTNLGENEAKVDDFESGYTITLALFREIDNAATNSISSALPGELLATLSQNAQPVASQVISFSTNLGAVDPSFGTGGAGTALTNSSGQAKIRLVPQGIEGAGTVTASVELPENKILRVSLNFEVTDADTNPQQSVDVSLSFASSTNLVNRIRSDAPGTVTARVVNEVGQAIENAIVTFSSNLISFNPSSGASLTNENGEASIAALAGDTTGVASITATISVAETEFSETLNITVDPPSIKIGSFQSDVFANAVLGVSANPLSAGGTTGISVTVVNEDNSIFETPVEVGFSSPCVNDKSATIDEKVNTVNGVANATYRAVGCVGTDRVTATLNFGGTQFTATSDLTINDAAAGSIRFTDADPSTIVLRGAGGQGLSESSNVSFQVFGSQGLPLANQSVNFSLTSTVGGITLNPSSATSDANGFVSTTVQSGTISTSVVVVATLAEADISTQSGILVVSTGLPDQDSMTLALSKLNPEAWDINGTQITVTAYAADQFNNPVPDGVNFSFTAEGGLIDPSCTTVKGSCSVTWTSQNPRPTNKTEVLAGGAITKNGIVTIMVSAVGAESFQDENGNGVFDDGDTFSDIPEAFRDDDTSGARDSGEPYIDFNVNGVHDIADGLYGGAECLHSSLCSPNQGATVFGRAVLVMSSSVPDLEFVPSATADYLSNEPIDVTFQDSNGNSLPGGTTIEVTTTVGVLSGNENFTISTTTIYPRQSSYAVAIPADTPAGSGILEFKITTPSGDLWSIPYTINYAATPPAL